MKRLRHRRSRSGTPAASALAEALGAVRGAEAWPQVLDGLSDYMSRLRSAVVDDVALWEPDEVVWTPPPGIGDLPVDLAPRAATLFQEMEALKALLERRREATLKQLRAVEAVPRDISTASVYLDLIG